MLHPAAQRPAAPARCCRGMPSPSLGGPWMEAALQGACPPESEFMVLGTHAEKNNWQGRRALGRRC